MAAVAMRNLVNRDEKIRSIVNLAQAGHFKHNFSLGHWQLKRYSFRNLMLTAFSVDR